MKVVVILYKLNYKNDYVFKMVCNNYLKRLIKFKRSKNKKKQVTVKIQ